MSELRVPKRTVEVEVSLPHIGTRGMALFLSEFAATHDGAESVADMLNGPEDFFPALDLELGQMTAVRRSAVCAVRMGPKDELTDPSELAVPLQVKVSVLLSDGQRVTGTLSYLMPAERSRPIDFLNDDGPHFFPLFAEPQVILINRRQIVRLEILGEDR